MDPLIATIVTRAIERLLVVLAGGLAIYLGYRLFIDMPSAERGSGKVNLPGGISIYLSRVGPGVFFSLFGAIVIGLSLKFGVSFNDSTQDLITAALEGTAKQEQRSYSGISDASSTTQGEVDTYERDRVLGVITGLNQAEAALPANLAPTSLISLRYALRDARERLLVSVWDPAWGDVTEFRAWIADNEPDPPPASISNAARLYRDGRVAANP